VLHQPKTNHRRDNRTGEPDIEIEFTFDKTNVTFEERAAVLLETKQLLLKLAYQVNGETIAYGVKFNRGQSVWEQIWVQYNYH
jgi:hypothetical protein